MLNKQIEAASCSISVRKHAILSPLTIICLFANTLSLMPVVMIRLLTSFDIQYDSSQGVNQLRKLLKTYMTSLRKETEYLKDLRTNWPQLVPHALKDKLLKSFRDATSSQTLREYTCAVCGESKFSELLHDSLVALDTIDLSLLNARHNGLVPDPFVENHPLKDLAIEPLGVVNSAETGQPLLRICPIPAELSELTVVEEAMIARRRAKSSNNNTWHERWHYHLPVKS
ncbi:hypothetical protein JB92DRAFT_570382 [Gautieria morchelliformis]|nr:hypothetical protein JB92DRAFT_570382 [Gautieria morchelliformis]